MNIVIDEESVVSLGLEKAVYKRDCVTALRLIKEYNKQASPFHHDNEKLQLWLQNKISSPREKGE